MTDFEHFKSPELQLTPEAAADLRDTLAKVLILRGRPTEAIGVSPVNDGEVPRDFSYPLDPAFLKELYFPNADVVVDAGEVKYFTPHRLDPDDAEIVEGGVYLIVETRLWNPTIPPAEQVRMDFSVMVGGNDAQMPVMAYHSTEYSQDGQYISPNNLESKRFGARLDDDEIAAHIIDRMAPQHPLTLEDAEKLQQIAAYVESQPRLD